MKFLRWLGREEKGQGTFEYALLLALVVLAVVAGASTLAGSINNAFSEASAGTSLTSSIGKVTAGTRESWSTSDFDWHTPPQVNEKVQMAKGFLLAELGIGRR
jgi:Flp pilus assembly pilin Flp